MRRLTGRSRYRATQALFYLHSATPAVCSVDLSELGRARSFLYCLSELQEIRLPCSEESLLDAMGLKIVDFAVVTGPTVADPRALVRTWIHDEGAHAEVVELARDLLVLTHYQDVGIWHQIVSHMTTHAMYRSLFETLVLIQATPVFADLSFGMMGAEILQSLTKVVGEAVERAEQVHYCFFFVNLYLIICVIRSLSL